MTEQVYAFIKNGYVTNIAIFDNPTLELLQSFIDENNLDEIVLANDRTQIDGEYDGTKFWTKKLYPSWIKNEELNKWEAPVPYPAFDEENPKYYKWNEEILNWEEIPE